MTNALKVIMARLATAAVPKFDTKFLERLTNEVSRVPDALLSSDEEREGFSEMSSEDQLEYCLNTEWWKEHWYRALAVDYSEDSVQFRKLHLADQIKECSPYYKRRT
jgi:hypothetical protein